MFVISSTERNVWERVGKERYVIEFDWVNCFLCFRVDKAFPNVGSGTCSQDTIRAVDIVEPVILVDLCHTVEFHEFTVEFTEAKLGCVGRSWHYIATETSVRESWFNGWQDKVVESLCNESWFVFTSWWGVKGSDRISCAVDVPSNCMGGEEIEVEVREGVINTSDISNKSGQAVTFRQWVSMQHCWSNNERILHHTVFESSNISRS